MQFYGINEEPKILNLRDKLLSKILRKGGKVDTTNTYTWPCTFLACYMHFNKRWRVYICLCFSVNKYY